MVSSLYVALHPPELDNGKRKTQQKGKIGMLANVTKHSQSSSGNARLVVDLLLVDRRLLFVVLAPDDVVLLVKVGALVSDRKNLAGVADCLSADAERVARNPDDIKLGSDGRVVVSVLLDLVAVHNRIGLRDDTTKGFVIGVNIRAQELCQHVGALVRSRSRESRVAFRIKRLLSTLLSSFLCRGITVVSVSDKKALLFRGDRLGESLKVRCDSCVEANVVQRREDEGDDHEDKRAKGATGIHVNVGSSLAVGRCLRGAATCHCEETNEADLSNVKTNKDLLQCAGVHGSLGVDIHVVDVEHVVAVGAVEEVQADSCEEQDKGCDSSVTDRDNLDVISNEEY
jgi:hypothetical protein